VTQDCEGSSHTYSILFYSTIEFTVSIINEVDISFNISCFTEKTQLEDNASCPQKTLQH
jgi:hypothetical protein